MRAAGFIVLSALAGCGGGGLSDIFLETDIQPSNATRTYRVSSAATSFDNLTGISSASVEQTGQGSTVTISTDAQGIVSVVELNILTGGVVVFHETFSGTQPANITLDSLVQRMRLVADGSVGSADVVIDTLESSLFGAWIVHEVGGDFDMGAFAGGKETPLASVPTSGSATYTGPTFGMGATGTNLFALSGSIRIDADFAGQDVTSTISDIATKSIDSGASGTLADLSGSGNITGNNYATTLSGGALSGALTGTFYGPNAEETAGVWAVSGGSTTAVGSFDAVQ
jgi:hypothetical protein